MSDKRVWFTTGAGQGMRIDFAEHKAKDLREQADVFRELSTSLARDDA